MPRTLSVAPAAPSGAAPEAPDEERPPGLPLGPDSLTWRYFGDTRGLLTTLRAAVLQTMHPTISAGLIDHSDVFRNQLARLARSAHPIVGVVYDEDWGATARWVRDVHKPVKGEHRPRFVRGPDRAPLLGDDGDDEDDGLDAGTPEPA